MKVHGIDSGLGWRDAKTICGLIVFREFTTYNFDEITCKNCLRIIKSKQLTEVKE